MTGTQANTMENGASQLDEVMQQRVREHFLGNQIPQAEQEADRLAAQVKDAHTPEEVKSQLGDQLGADFSGVRFHTGAQAQQMADGIGARAYTAGNDVYFGQGGFDPSVAAHELVHTAQQGVVDSSVSTVAAPMGGVQMMPKFLSKIGNGIKQAGRGLLNFGRAGGRMISDASHWVGNKAQAAGSWLGGKARAAGSWIGGKAKAAGNWFKGLFRSKEDRNLDALDAVTVPSRAGEQQPHLPFSERTMDALHNGDGIRSGHATIKRELAPVMAPLADEVDSYFQSVSDSGFDFKAANEGAQEYNGGHFKVAYNKTVSEATKHMLGMMEKHLDQPEMQGLMRDVYANQINNRKDDATGEERSKDKTESNIVNSFMTMGLMPTAKPWAKATTAVNNGEEGAEDKAAFFNKLSRNAPYVEALYKRKDDENMPPELLELVETYAPIREKILEIMRNQPGGQ